MIDDRTKRIGASDVPAVMGVDPFRTRYEAAMEKQGKLEDNGGSAATHLGHLVEPGLLDQAERDLGPLHRQVLMFAEGTSYPLSATVDGLTSPIGVNEPPVVVECKSSGLAGPVYGDWGEPGTDQVPDYVLVQVTAQMMCTGAELAYVYALLGGRGLNIYSVPYDRDLDDMIHVACREFWERYVLGGEMPEQTDTPPLAVLKRLRRTSDKVVELGSDAVALLAQLDAQKQNTKDATKAVEATKAQLLSLLGDAEIGRLQDGREITFFETRRKGYSTEDTTYRTLRVRKS